MANAGNEAVMRLRWKKGGVAGGKPAGVGSEVTGLTGPKRRRGNPTLQIVVSDLVQKKMTLKKQGHLLTLLLLPELCLVLVLAT